MLLLLAAANSLVMAPPPQMAFMQQVGVQQAAVQQLSARAAIFPTSTILAGKPKPDGEIEGVAKGTSVAKKCAPPEELLAMGSGQSGRQVSKSCSAQLAQAKIMQKQQRAIAQADLDRKAAKEEAAVAAAAAGPMFSLGPIKF